MSRGGLVSRGGPVSRAAWAPGALLGVGLALNVLGLLGIYEAPRLRADVRSPGWGGPGMGVQVLDPFPSPGEAVRLRAMAWGELRTGIADGRVRLRGVEVDQGSGAGARWGNELLEQRGTASDELLLGLVVPADAPVGVPIPVEVELSWVQAVSTESLGFTNQGGAGALRFELVPTDSRGRWLGRLKAAALPLLALVVVWRLAAGLHRLAKAHATHEALLTGLGCLTLGVGALGYWAFGWPLARAAGSPPSLDLVLTGVFIALPVGRFFWLDHRDP